MDFWINDRQWKIEEVNSDWLLTELYNQRDYYQNKYLINKGLI